MRSLIAASRAVIRAAPGPDRVRTYNRAMRERLEEDPEHEEASPSQSAIPTVTPVGREFEYRTDALTNADVTKGTKLIELLNKSAADGWDLVEIINAGDNHVVLQRKGKPPKRDSRRVGFTLPGGR